MYLVESQTFESDPPFGPISVGTIHVRKFGPYRSKIIAYLKGRALRVLGHRGISIQAL